MTPAVNVLPTGVRCEDLKLFCGALYQIKCIQLFVQLLQLGSAWMIIMALGGDEQLMSYLLVFLISSIVAVLPISIGGMGVRELTFLYGAQIL